MPAWIWFVVALVAAAGGALLLWYDRARPDRRGNDRRDWAASKGWEFTDALSSPPHAWRYGTLRGDGPRQAYDVATGAVPGPGGRRLGCIFDQEQDGRTVATIAAVRGTVAVPVALELRLPESPRPDDDELDNLGQVGRRYAFVSNALEGRRLLTRPVTDAADRVGADVPLVWAEDTWVLASIEPDADPDRIEGLIESLVEVSAAIKEAVEGGPTARDDDAPTAVVGKREPDRAVPAVGSPADESRTETVEREDDSPTTVVDRSGRDAPPTGRPSGARPATRDDDSADSADPDDYDDEFEAFASGDDDASPYAGGDERGGRPTHRDRPADIPYDLESDDPDPEEPRRDEQRSSQGSTWRSGKFRGR
ncbi:hypothetical protein [Actinomycetospora sp. NBRC 106378]|uniref:hypothetical protein n=1 Tax=Actinomycetospora sp. NBRC 106378 TaxID=3032208 RepID=UPI0024A58634|nr:hypothetical protein [Actinomycetospora sp. NBRC 106378]GLZ51172.1 hypothetical protein Acsp07_07890 [Actinomycetospora sp. NBRC 106378]